ncbi:MAG: phage holin family protein [Myxococcales bacterium]
MLDIIINLLVTAGAVVLASKMIPGVRVKSFGAALVVAGIFGLLNALLGKLLFHVFAIATLGLGYLLFLLTAWVVNTVLLRLTDKLVDGFEIPTWGKTAATALVISGVSAVASLVL